MDRVEYIPVVMFSLRGCLYGQNCLKLGDISAESFLQEWANLNLARDSHRLRQEFRRRRGRRIKEIALHKTPK